VQSTGDAWEGVMSTLTSNSLRNSTTKAQALRSALPVWMADPGADSLRTFEADQRLPSCRLRRVTEYIQQNLEKDLPLADLAAVVYMSPYHFARLFRCSTGVPPTDSWSGNESLAPCLSGDEELSISQISEMVGFRTPSHFATVFRRVLGITPGAYRTVSLRDRVAGKEGEMIARRASWQSSRTQPSWSSYAKGCGAAEALVDAYGIASTAWPFASRAMRRTRRRLCRIRCGR
jgi:AraC-like DNA-binding protein